MGLRKLNQTVINTLNGLTANASELNILDGVTATTAELNKLAGVTATTQEIEKLAGVTATTQEINKLDGVTGAIEGFQVGTPVNAVAATGVLTFAGVVIDGETVTIDTDVYEFDADASVAGGNITVDISAGTKVQSTGALTVAGTVADGETVTIGADVYEFDTDSSVAGGNIAVDVSAGATTAATGTLTFTGVVADGQTVTIDNEVYEFDTNGAVTQGNIQVNVAGDQTAAAAITALVAVITINSTKVTAVDGAGDTVDVTAKVPGAAANAFATTETCTNASWGNVTLVGGVDPTNLEAVTALVAAITASDTVGVGGADGGGGVLNLTADAAGAVDGSVGNAVATTETCANASFAAATLTGGSDATAGEAVTALVAAVTASDTVGVGAADGAGDTVDLTADTKGTAANAFTTTETCANGSFAAATLTGGVNGTVAASAGIWYRDNSYAYVSIAANTIADANWRRVAIVSF